MATKTMNHNYWGCALEEKPPQWEVHMPQRESSPHSLQQKKALEELKIQCSESKEKILKYISAKKKEKKPFPIHHTKALDVRFSESILSLSYRLYLVHFSFGILLQGKTRPWEARAGC